MNIYKNILYWWIFSRNSDSKSKKSRKKRHSQALDSGEEQEEGSVAITSVKPLVEYSDVRWE